jgi:Tfp pilus assembly protein PilZ
VDERRPEDREARAGDLEPKRLDDLEPKRLDDLEPKRLEPRVTINKEFDSFDQFVREYVTNISRSGVFIKTAEPLRVGSIVNLKFTVVMDDVATIEGEGEVVRVESNPSGMGVVFRKLGQYSKNLVEKLLTAQHDA